MINTHGIIPQSVNIFGIEFYFYGLIVALAVMLLYITSRSRLEEKGYTERDLDVAFLVAILLGIVGGRIFYVILNWDLFATAEEGLIDTLKIWNGGIHLFGVFAGSLLALLVVAKLIKKSFFEITDSIALYVPLAQAVGRLANMINLELFGPPTDLPWSFFLPKSKRPFEFRNYESFHPLFLYEAVLDIANFFILKHVSGQKVTAGMLTALYFLNYAVIRFSIEFLRVDTEPILFGLKLVQIICILIVVACSIVFAKEMMQSKEKRAREF